jgi:hypothetical protein
MTKSLLTLPLVALVAAVVGCSDDHSPTASHNETPTNTATTTWDDAGAHWRTVVDASDYDAFTAFSFASRDTVSDAGLSSTDEWQIAFRREVIKLNGGSSGSGDAVAANLGQVSFADVGLGDTAGVSWEEDATDYFIDQWYDYNPVTHQLSANQYVYSMVDAEGDNYVKFRVDSLVDAGMPPQMGTVYITYFYQNSTGSTDLSGATQKAAIPVGDSTACFDFSAGSASFPSELSTSLGWDIGFSSYNCFQNSGPSGSGQCAAFPAFSELADSTNIDAFTAQPAEAPLFPDIPSSTLTEWYNYNDQTHQLTSKANVYLIRTGGNVYKVRIDSYYANIQGTPVSGHYTFVWDKL